MLLSPCPAEPVKRELPLWTSAMRLPSLVSCFILESLLARKSIWPSLERVTREYSGSSACSIMNRVSRISLLAAHALQVGLPALPVRRVGEHEVELAGREGVVGEGGMLRPSDDVVGSLPLPLEQEIGLADRVGLGVDLLSVEVGGHLLALLGFAICCSTSSATVSMPPVPQAPS